MQIIGAVRVRMEKASPKDRLVQCFYEAPEPGEYTVSVSWSGQPVPGSPFTVRLFGTREELEQFSANAGYGEIPYYGPSSVSVPEGAAGFEANGYNQ